jgi:hypothetical protein
MSDALREDGKMTSEDSYMIGRNLIIYHDDEEHVCTVFIVCMGLPFSQSHPYQQDKCSNGHNLLGLYKTPHYVTNYIPF